MTFAEAIKCVSNGVSVHLPHEDWYLKLYQEEQPIYNGYGNDLGVRESLVDKVAAYKKYNPSYCDIYIMSKEEIDSTGWEVME